METTQKQQQYAAAFDCILVIEEVVMKMADVFDIQKVEMATSGYLSQKQPRRNSGASRDATAYAIQTGHFRNRSSYQSMLITGES